MSISIALRHRTHYRYDRPVMLGPQVVRLRPAPHCRTRIASYSLNLAPDRCFINWQQDVHANYLARVVFSEATTELCVDVGLVAEMTAINPFDFYLEPTAEQFPFAYNSKLLRDLQPYLAVEPPGPLLRNYLASLPRTAGKTIDLLVEINQRLERDVDYLIRMEPGVQSCEETLRKRSGSCRDTTWLLVQLLRRLGFAARFVSGYLIQLKPDAKPLEGPEGPQEDFCDLHAWAEAYLPGAGWVGLDPTSGLLAGEGHLPLACTPSPDSAAPITGAVDPCESEFSFSMSVERLVETPRVTKPYTPSQWRDINELGRTVDRALDQDDVRLTMGGEPTFVAIDNVEHAQWNTAALGEDKRARAEELLLRLKDRFGANGFVHCDQGKWYPGEVLPRWALRCYWRKDGEPLWDRPELMAAYGADYGHGAAEARALLSAIADRLGLASRWVIDAFEDAMYYMWKERRLPIHCDPKRSNLEDQRERERICRVFEQGLNAAVGVLLPLRAKSGEQVAWESGPWAVRSEDLFLIPGDSPMGLRLPLQSLVRDEATHAYPTYLPRDPWEPRPPAPIREALWRAVTLGAPRMLASATSAGRRAPVLQTALGDFPQSGAAQDPHAGRATREAWFGANGSAAAIPTAMCVEPRGGRLHVFFPPVEHLEAYLTLLTAVESAATELALPVVIEGYGPPQDPRLQHFSVTPDPGVIEVNVHPAADWSELRDITLGVYEDARATRLAAEKFDRDGLHAGSGGGAHVVLGGPTPADSPFLRRPDVLRSLIAYWHNHPSLSYLFSGRFIGPTSQAPRADEARVDARYELQIALDQIPDRAETPPWLVDRILRHLLVDGTGNTHRAEFCIDKLFSPDSASGRLGLVEMRALEMPPHPEMNLAQQLLMRALVARFWREPYRGRLEPWNTVLHDRFMLPYFVWSDFEDVLRETANAGFALQAEWFRPQFEFRFPQIGEFAHEGVRVELRQAIEPWYVLGEETAPGATARYVDSSVERLQVRVRGWTRTRHRIVCNGSEVPLHPVGDNGEAVAGVRYRRWRPPSCLHPTIPVDDPLVFDLIDAWRGVSRGGCRFYSGHPGGKNPDAMPVNAAEAESRRQARFVAMGSSGESLPTACETTPDDFPLTVDLRRD